MNKFLKLIFSITFVLITVTSFHLHAMKKSTLAEKTSQLFSAAEEVNFDACKQLLENTKFPNSTITSAMWFVLNHLFYKGKHNLMIIPLMFQRDIDEKLYATTIKIRLEIIELFLDAGADINHRDFRGKTPLHYVSSPENWHFKDNKKLEQIMEPFVDLFIEYDAHPDKPTFGRTTPLMSASRFGFVKIVTKLLKAGADVSAQNRANETALDQVKYWIKAPSSSLEELFKKYQAIGDKKSYESIKQLLIDAQNKKNVHAGKNKRR